MTRENKKKFYTFLVKLKPGVIVHWSEIGDDYSDIMSTLCWFIDQAKIDERFKIGDIVISTDYKRFKKREHEKFKCYDNYFSNQKTSR